jgi:feruloyl esterase
LLCHGADTPACLTAPQVEAVKKLYEGPGEQIYPGLLPGGEAGPGGWGNWITGPKPGASGHANLGLPFFKYIVFEDPEWDVRSFKFETAPGFDNDVQFLDDKLAAIFNATNPDLRAFQQNGGKLIQYHGWSDPDITPLNSIHYYESVVSATPGTSDFYRLFLVPGMQHCGGGPGPTQFDTISALERWVEKGVAPDKIVASHATGNGVVDRTRPLCPYPQQAEWKGTGSTDVADNFVCSLPRN